MREVQTGKPRADLLRLALWCAALVGAAAVLYVIASASFKPKHGTDLADLRRGELAQLEIPLAGTPAPDVAFEDGAGKPVRLTEFKGEVVVVNFWATWCAPCVTEMPTLARLQATYAAQPMRVVAISVDRRTDDDLARAFIARNPPLTLYRDPSYKTPFALQPRAKGFPTTVIYDRKGVERARLSGPADWSSREARELVERLLAER